jgi:2'-5' RNA ligase superfamily
MFHALPPSLEGEARQRLSQAAFDRAPRATIAGLMDLGRGVAFRIVSEDLDRIRDHLSDSFHGMLGAQDQAGWRPHITIQNKVAVSEARQLLETLGDGFQPRPLGIRGLGLHRYLGGPWETLQVWPFRT